MGAVKFHSRDVNNGLRSDFWAGTASTDTVYVTDRTYAFTTDAGGIGVDQDYLSAVVVGNNTQTKYNYLETPMLPMPVDDRGEAGVAKFNGIEYDKLVTTVSVPLKYANKTTVIWTLFIDRNISESKAVADAYTTIDNPKQFYNRAKSFLYDNYQGEDETIVSRSGTEIDAGSFNIIIDKTAPTAFAFDGTTITIKADTFTGSITTTGTFTLKNGVVIQNGEYDCDVHVLSNLTTLTLSQVTITGLIYNDSTNPLTVSLFSGSSVTAGDPGTGNGETDVIVSATLTVSGLFDNTEVRLYTSDLNTEIGGIENSVGPVNIVIHQTYTDAVLVIHHIEYEPIRLEVDLTLVDTNIPIKQRLDRNYNNPI